MSSSLRVTSPSGIPAAAAAWRSRRHGEAHVVVCKATYRLDAGEAQLASEQEPLAFGDAYWDDDSSRGLRVASDFAVAKRRADVLVVGSAFAPGGAPVHRLVANFGVGELEKAIEVSGERWVDIRDELHEGAPFTSMPLTWERASNEGDGRNPAGRPSARDPFGRLQLPNLGPVAFAPTPPSWSVPLVGVGPIAPSWPQRALGLGDGASSLRATRFGALWPEDWIERGVPEEADLSFFQVAPADQQLERLGSDVHIVIENLSPTSAILGTRLPGHRVRAFVAPSASELDLVCDTLLIDTERQLVTLTWRATLYASVFPRIDRVLVLLEHRDARTPADEIRRMCAPKEEATMGAELSHADDGLPFAGRGHSARFANPPTMDSYVGTPFGRAAGAPPAPPSSTGAAAPPAMSALQSFETTELPAIASTTLGSSRIGLTMLGAAGLAAPAGAQQPAPAPPPAPPPPASPPAPAQAPLPAPAPPPLARPAPAPVPAAVVQPPVVAVAPLGPVPLPAPVPPPPPIAAPSPVAPPVMVAPPAPVAGLASGAASGRAFSTAALAQAAKPPAFMGDAREPAVGEAKSHDAKAALQGVAGASDAAADKTPRRAARGAEPAERAQRPAGFFDLMWVSPSAADRLKTLPEWAKLLRGGSKEWLTEKAREGRSADDSERLVRRALARGTPLDGGGIHKAVLDAVDEDGVLVRPIVTVEGEVAVSFDPIEALNVSLSLSEHLAASDKKFKEAHDAAGDLVRSNRKVTLPMIESGLTRLRQAFATSGKAYPAGYLESTAERWLVDERRYLKRTVLGAERLIASLTPVGGGAPLPLYLPVELEQYLPTVPRFKARALVEPHARQDAAEGDPTSLVAIAVARVVGR